MNMNVLKDRLFRILKMTLAFCLFGLNNTLMVKAAIGSSSWVALNQGIALHTPLTIGQANTAVGVVIVGLDLIMGEPIGIGTLLNAFTIGAFNDMWMSSGIVPTPESYVLRMVMLIASLFLSALGSVLYMGAAMGCGPRDTLMVMINKRVRKLTHGNVVIIVSIVVLIVAWLLGAPVGLGTVICFTLQGTIFDIVQGILHFKPVNVKHENILETFKALFSK